jgi:hypothetical protein
MTIIPRRLVSRKLIIQSNLQMMRRRKIIWTRPGESALNAANGVPTLRRSAGLRRIMTNHRNWKKIIWAAVGKVNLLPRDSREIIF